MSKIDLACLTSLDAGPTVHRRLTYEDFRREVLKAGRFSAFEASANARCAGMYSRLAKDPNVVLDHESVGYPWTIVRARKSEAAS